jgi:hypothetical protein
MGRGVYDNIMISMLTRYVKRQQATAAISCSIASTVLPHMPSSAALPSPHEIEISSQTEMSLKPA